MTPRLRILVGWWESCDKYIKTHWWYITDGLGESIINRAIDVQYSRFARMGVNEPTRDEKLRRL